MRTHIYIILAIVFAAFGCSKDLGNYDYTKVNQISIDSVMNGEHNSQRIYRIVYGDSIKIKPEIKGTLSGSDTTNLRFLWTLDDVTISTSKDLMRIADFGYGKMYGNLYITDVTTNVITNFNFTLEISNDAARGTYILAEDDARNSILYTHSSINVNNTFREITELGPFKLGKKPLSINLRINYGSSSTNYTYTMILASEEAEYKVMEVSATNMLPSLLFGDDAFVSPPVSINMTQALLSLRSNKLLYILNNGKVHSGGSGMFSEVLYYQDPLDYNFGPDGLFPNGSLFSRHLAGWDYKNKRFRIFSTTGAAPTDVYTTNYDNLMDPALTAGHTYVAGVECFTSNPYKFAMLTKKDNTLYAFNASLNTYVSVASFNKVGELVIPDLNKMIKPVYHGGMDFWYFAIGRKIYRTSVTGLELQLVLTLPNDDSGDIVAFNFNNNAANNFSHIGITTYNPASNKSHKGSFYMFDIGADKISETHLNVIHKAKGLQIGF